MNQPKRNLKIWIPIAALLCFWLGDWMGHTYELTEGTTTHRLAAALAAPAGEARKILPLFWMKTRRTICRLRHRKA